jgi:hypothetical protein
MMKAKQPRSLFRDRPHQPVTRSDRQTAVIVTPRVGSVDRFPAPYELSTCRLCGCAVWLNVALREWLEGKGLEPACVCFGGCYATRRQTENKP